MSTAPSELILRLAGRASSVCRQYLSHGCRVGKDRAIRDARNASGQSLFVRPRRPNAGKRAGGKWIDNVAAWIMARASDWFSSCGRSPVFPQRNPSTQGMA
jgi:hypothetical protein